MEKQELLNELLRLSDAGELNGVSWPDSIAVDPALIEALKKEVDFYIRSDAQEALKRAELAYWLSEQVSDPLAKALGIRAKAQALHVLGRYGEAIEFYERARLIYQSENRPVENGRIARAAVDALMYQGRYDEALALASDAREIFSTYGERLLAAQLETNVGNIHHRMDQYRQALECYERAGEVFEELSDLTAQAVVAFNCANIYSNLDDFRQSQALYERAYELYDAQGMELAATQVRYSLGYLHFLKGECHQAMRVLHEVREQVTRLKDERLAALCELDLAEIYLQLNLHHEAANLAALARDRFQTLTMRYEAAKSLTYRGLAMLHQDKLAEAEEALRIAQQEFAEEENEVYRGLIDIYLAELSIKRKQPAEALGLATEAEEIFSRQSLKAKTAYARLVAAKALMQCGESGRAREVGEAIMEDGRDWDAHWLKYQTCELLGDALMLESGDRKAAYEHYEQSIGFIEKIRAGIGVDEFRSAFFRDKLQVYEKLIRLCLDQGDNEGQAKAFFYLESRKARTLVDMLVNDTKTAPAGEEETQSEFYRQWRELRDELHWFSSKVSKNETSGQRRLMPLNNQLREEIRMREQALAELARQAQIHDPSFVSLNNSTGLEVTELRDALAEDEIVIEYYFDGEELKIFLIGRNELRVLESAYSRDEVKGLVSELKFQFEKSRYSNLADAARQRSLLASANACLRELYWALFAPVASLVEGRRLIFIPFDVLHYVPFQALYDGSEYLLDRHEIAYAPSARLFLLTARHKECGSGGSRALIIGAPDDVAPHIAEEIEAIRDMFPDAQCFTGADASASTLARHFSHSNIVHIACHAVFRQDNPMFSAFKLSDAWLNFYDICSLNAPGSLVVLSGCSTGAGGGYAGDEMLGLVRGFLYANAATLVVSLWAVNDPATAYLMKNFYARLHKGDRPRAALRLAALGLRQQYPHPYYWAPFVCIGHN
jgi:CHAT domain-containing protein